MVRIAVVGGTSPTPGRSIVTALVNNGKYDVVILSRNKSDGKVSCPLASLHICTNFFTLHIFA